MKFEEALLMMDKGHKLSHPCIENNGDVIIWAEKGHGRESKFLKDRYGFANALSIDCLLIWINSDKWELKE